MNKEKAKILIVDDNLQNLMTVEAILAPEGYSLITARSGNEALRQLLDTEVAVIIVDVVMPGMDGFEFARVVRSREKTARTPIIFTSGLQVDETDVSTGYELGAIDYITLPLIPHILRAKVGVLVALCEREKELIKQIAKVSELEKRHYEQRMELLNQERQKEREQEQARILQERAESLEQSNRELNRFSTTVAHDLQEPLRTISGYLALLQQEQKGKLSGKSKEHIKFILEASKRMSKLITDLLKYSQVDNTKERKREACTFQSIVSRACENLAGTIEQRQATITYRGLPAVQGDEALLTQMLQNLISNAIKFCPEKPPSVDIGFSDDGQFWRFSVKDNGIGIPARYVGRAFNAFERLHDRKLFPGTGVGLAICKRIIESHGGRVWVESMENVGTTFHFTLPKSQVEVRHDLSGMRILVVDDDCDTGTFLQYYFGQMGAQVDCASSGATGVEVALKKIFDLVVLDIQMPEMDGFQTIKSLHQRGYQGPAIAYTGVDIGSKNNEFRDAGFSHVVSKNAGPAALAEQLKNFQNVSNEKKVPASFQEMA